MSHFYASLPLLVYYVCLFVHGHWLYCTVYLCISTDVCLLYCQLLCVSIIVLSQLIIVTANINDSLHTRLSYTAMMVHAQTLSFQAVLATACACWSVIFNFLDFSEFTNACCISDMHCPYISVCG